MNRNNAQFKAQKKGRKYAVPELDEYVQVASSAYNRYLAALGHTEDYVDLMSASYYFSQGGHRRLKAGLKASFTDELVEYFEHEFEEEKDHPELALADLSALGRELSFERPLEVQLTWDLWDRLSALGVYGYLGAQYTLENMSSFIGKEAVKAMNRLGIPQGARVFILAHLELDGGATGHGQYAARICQAYFDRDPAACMKGGCLAAHAWAAALNGLDVRRKVRERATAA